MSPAAIEDVPGLEDLFDGVTGDIPSVRVNLDPVRVSRLGLTPADAAAQVRAALFGEEAGAVREPDRLVPIRVRLADSVRFNPAVARTLPIIGPNGWATLGSLGAVGDSSDVSELLRENLRPMVLVTGAVDPETSNLGDVMRGIRERLTGLALPPGVSLEYGGQYAGQRESFRQLLVVLVLAIGIVLLVMVGQFGDFRGPVAILLAASLGLTGALLALVITGVPFNVSSFMGLILLVGLIVKNGIILLDAAHANPPHRSDPRDGDAGGRPPPAPSHPDDDALYPGGSAPARLRDRLGCRAPATARDRGDRRADTVDAHHAGAAAGGTPGDRGAGERRMGRGKREWGTEKRRNE